MNSQPAISASRNSAKRVLSGVRLDPRKRVQEHIQVSMAKQTRRKCRFVGCGKSFHPRRYWQKFCSRRCRIEDWKLHHPMIAA